MIKSRLYKGVKLFNDGFSWDNPKQCREKFPLFFHRTRSFFLDDILNNGLKPISLIDESDYNEVSDGINGRKPQINISDFNDSISLSLGYAQSKEHAYLGPEQLSEFIKTLDKFNKEYLHEKYSKLMKEIQDSDPIVFYVRPELKPSDVDKPLKGDDFVRFVFDEDYHKELVRWFSSEDYCQQTIKEIGLSDALQYKFRVNHYETITSNVDKNTIIGWFNLHTKRFEAKSQ